MSSFKNCSTALAILMASSLPVLAQDRGTLRDRPDQVVVSVRGTDIRVQVPLRQAARVCDADANDLARSSRGTSEPACSISRSEAEAIGIRFGRDDGRDGHDDGRDDHDRHDRGGDGNKGHGNDRDGFDEDNPGNSRGVAGGRGQGNGNGNRGGRNND